MLKKVWKYRKECTIIKNCDKNESFRFRLACIRINYLLLDVKGTKRKKFDISLFGLFRSHIYKF
jgi:hypothetical protein